MRKATRRAVTGATVALLAALGACYVEWDDPYHGWWDPYPVYVNGAPWVLDGEAGCFWDSLDHDDIWYFDAEIDDPDGAWDVVDVEARVYDERLGVLVEVLPLDRTVDPTFWTSEWLAHTTALDCWYGGYAVDVLAWDAWGARDVRAVPVLTYVRPFGAASTPR